MHLETLQTPVNKSQQELYELLIKVENYEKIMPESIQKFEVTGSESFIFQLKGMPEISLKIEEKTPFEKIILGSGNDKIPFTLTVELLKASEISTTAQLFFDGQFNSMMAMMIKKPLKKFIHTLTENMTNL